MGLFKKKVPEQPPDHRTEAVLDKMDVFLVEMQKVADRLIEKLDEQGRSGG